MKETSFNNNKQKISILNFFNSISRISNSSKIEIYFPLPQQQNGLFFSIRENQNDFLMIFSFLGIINNKQRRKKLSYLILFKCLIALLYILFISALQRLLIQFNENFLLVFCMKCKVLISAHNVKSEEHNVCWRIME